jgi:hypothetical protein
MRQQDAEKFFTHLLTPYTHAHPAAMPEVVMTTRSRSKSRPRRLRLRLSSACGAQRVVVCDTRPDDQNLLLVHLSTLRTRLPTHPPFPFWTPPRAKAKPNTAKTGKGLVKRAEFRNNLSPCVTFGSTVKRGRLVPVPNMWTRLMTSTMLRGVDTQAIQALISANDVGTQHGKY